MKTTILSIVISLITLTDILATNSKVNEKITNLELRVDSLEKRIK